MGKLFYGGLIGLLAFEFLKIYFIMPMPGSQGADHLDFAYFLHSYRWVFRVALVALVITGLGAAYRARRRWIPILVTLLMGGAIYVLNWQMAAERMFLEPQELVFRPAQQNTVPPEAVVVGVALGGEAKAYPIRFLVYHHQVQDTVGGQAVLVTYCSVCRTGRVFEPTVQGQPQQFRLVGMDHFNAMLEDSATGSWWRQANGRAVAGPLKGQSLRDLPMTQATLASWLALHPTSLVMQPDPTAIENYDTTGRFERGESKGELTRTDRASWNEKSWVVGIEIKGRAKAYDWNRLLEQHVVNDMIGDTPVVLALAPDNQTFVAFVRPDTNASFALVENTLVAGDARYDWAGHSLTNPDMRLTAVNAYQEFWHSWRTFHPDTERFP